MVRSKQIVGTGFASGESRKQGQTAFATRCIRLLAACPLARLFCGGHSTESPEHLHRSSLLLTVRSCVVHLQNAWCRFQTGARLLGCNMNTSQITRQQTPHANDRGYSLVSVPGSTHISVVFCEVSEREQAGFTASAHLRQNRGLLRSVGRLTLRGRRRKR